MITCQQKYLCNLLVAFCAAPFSQVAWAICEAEKGSVIEAERIYHGKSLYKMPDEFMMLRFQNLNDQNFKGMEEMLLKSQAQGRKNVLENAEDRARLNISVAHDALSLCFFYEVRRKMAEKYDGSSRIGSNQPIESQQSEKPQQLALATQAKADQERQGKRKTHDPAAEAHQCIKIDPNPSGNFGAFINGCGYKVNFVTCNYRPRIKQGGFNWADDANCEKNGIGLHTPGAGASVAAHNRGTEKVYWFACKAPAFPTDARFLAGSGITARCY